MRFAIVIFILLLFCAIAHCQEADQQFSEFNLSGHSKDGKKTWEVKGETADVLEDSVKLKNIDADLYGKEKVNLKAQTGDLNKSSGDMHLEKDVVATTETGSKLTTNSLDWNRTSNMVTTKDPVKIEQQNMVTTGTGAQANTDLKKAQLKEEVQVEIQTEDANKNLKKTVITCDGPLDIDYQNSMAVFNDNVRVKDENGEMTSKTMEVFFDTKTKSVEKIIAKGNVKIIRDGNESFSQGAIYTARDKKITLIGRPRLILYSEKGVMDNAPFGD